LRNLKRKISERYLGDPMTGRQFVFKILLCGDGAVGKTSIRERYMGKGFKGSYLKTIGADFASKKLKMGDHEVTMQIFDLAGQDAYVAARKAFYKGGRAAFLVFDLQDEQTLINLRKWAKDSIEYSNGSISTFIILGNKADLVETRMVSKERAIQFARQLSAETGLDMIYLETSAKTGQNIKEAFEFLAYTLLKESNIEIPPNVYKIPESVEIITPQGIISQTIQEEKQGISNVSSTVNEKVEEVKDQLQADLQGTIQQLELRITNLEQKMDQTPDYSKEIAEIKEQLSEIEDRVKRMGHVLKTIVESINKA